MRPTSPHVREVAARSRELVAADRLGENAELLRNAVRRFADDAEVHLLAAAATRAVGSHQEAERLTRRGGELAWDDPHRLTWAASQILDQGDVDQAQAWIARVYELAPDDFDRAADLTHLVGRLALARGREDEAERMFRMAYELDPDTPTHGRRLAEHLEQTGRLDEAVEIRGDALRRTLRGLRAGNANVYDVREALQSADVWVPHEGADGETDVTLSMLDAETIPLFSSSETMEAAMGPGQAHLQVPFNALVSGLPEGVGAVVDTGSEWELRLPAHTLIATPTRPGS
jgi:tetratricopeptide (TPR) repeat protein